MATNYTLAEARKEIMAGNKEVILDVGRRFPLATTLLAKIGNNEAVDELINALPEHITVRKIESVLKDGVNIIDDAVEPENVEKEMMNLPVEEKKEKPAKKEKAAKETKSAKKEKNVEEKKEEVEEEDAASELDYSSMSAMDLYKLCKKNGIKTEPKQKAEVYINLLTMADESTSEDEDDEWDI